MDRERLALAMVLLAAAPLAPSGSAEAAGMRRGARRAREVDAACAGSESEGVAGSALFPQATRREERHDEGGARHEAASEHAWRVHESLLRHEDARLARRDRDVRAVRRGAGDELGERARRKRGDALVAVAAVDRDVDGVAGGDAAVGPDVGVRLERRARSAAERGVLAADVAELLQAILQVASGSR